MNNENKKMLMFQSARFGEFTVAEDTLICFPGGLVGFPNDERFVILEHKEPFCWLHSVDNPGLAFVVIEGGEFGEVYKFQMPFGDTRIDLKPEDESAVLIIVTFRTPSTLTTANLKAPLVVNLRNRKGLQLIVDDPRFSTRTPLWQEDDNNKGGS
jgi:flagellar assembly factor FliW